VSPTHSSRTDYRNAQRKYQGHSQHPLNDAGRRQAQRLADVLRSVPIKQIHASDLPRAEEVCIPTRELVLLSPR
jgi:broad specificity phosphatase PhoE